VVGGRRAQSFGNEIVSCVVGGDISWCPARSAAEASAITALGRPDGRLFGGDPTTHEEM